MTKTSSNVVRLTKEQRMETSPEAIQRLHDQASAYFFGMEPEIRELFVLAELARRTYQEEKYENRTTVAGSPLELILKDIERRAKELHQKY